MSKPSTSGTGDACAVTANVSFVSEVTNVPDVQVAVSLAVPGLRQSKQMIHIDKDMNPVPCYEDLRPPEIVVENSIDEPQPISSWSAFSNMAVLPVICNDTNGELYKNRFGSGGKGRCIKVDENWYTPIQFKALCGRASTKDWTKSIRFGGGALERLIEEEILKLHATSCICAICCDNVSARSPVRLHISRRRRKVSGGESPSHNYKCDNSGDENDNEVVVQNVYQNDDDDILEKLDEMTNKLFELALEFKTTVKKAKELKRQLRRE